MKRNLLALAAAAGAVLLVGVVASMGARHVSTSLMQILSPLPTASTRPTERWNGLPEEYKFNPFKDLEHMDDLTSPEPWQEHGQFGTWMGINDDTINGFGCGPNGPMDCSVGTTPGQHFAKKGSKIARNQKLLVGSQPIDPNHKIPAPSFGYGNQAAPHNGPGFYNTKDTKPGHALKPRKAGSTLKQRKTQSLSPVMGPGVKPTERWNGLPVDYKFDPFLDMEHNDRTSIADPWSEKGQYGTWMGISDDTINGFGCGPNGPLDCSVGTTPGQHYARAMGAQRAQEALIAIPVAEVPTPRIVYI